MNGLFTNWKLGFVFDPRLHDIQLLVLSTVVLHGELIPSSLQNLDPTQSLFSNLLICLIPMIFSNCKYFPLFISGHVNCYLLV